eukprot:9578529-Prorocentrum_lima.AAC.1
MTSSLVGSEMCIRDSTRDRAMSEIRDNTSTIESVARGQALSYEDTVRPVSYTHLTLPTICSV